MLILNLAQGASLAFSRYSFSRPRKRRPWSRFCIIENRVVSYTPKGGSSFSRSLVFGLRSSFSRHLGFGAKNEERAS